MDYAFAARRGAHRGQRADLKWTKTEPSEPVFSTAIRLRRCRTWSTWTTKRLITHQYFPAGWNTSRNCSREVVDGELRRWRTELEQLRGNVRTPTRLGITTRATGEPKERRWSEPDWPIALARRGRRERASECAKRGASEVQDVLELARGVGSRDSGLRSIRRRDIPACHPGLFRGCPLKSTGRRHRHPTSLCRRFLVRHRKWAFGPNAVFRRGRWKVQVFVVQVLHEGLDGQAGVFVPGHRHPSA